MKGGDDGGSDEQTYTLPFSERRARSRFVRGVYLIMALLMLLTAATCAVFLHVKAARNFGKAFSFYILTYILLFFCYFAMLSMQSGERRRCCNISLILLMGVVQSVFCGSVSVFHDTEQLLMATSCVTFVYLVTALYSLQRKREVIGWPSYLLAICILGLLWLSAVLLLCYSAHCEALSAPMCVAAIAGIVSLYTAFCTDMIARGKWETVSDTDYIGGVVLIYVFSTVIFQNIQEVCCTAMHCCRCRRRGR